MGNWAKGKSEHKFTYTYSDIAKITGLAKGTLKLYAYRKKFNPYDLLSVTQFIAKYTAKN